MIRRPPRSTQGVSSAASDVYKRQAQLHTLFSLTYFHVLEHNFLRVIQARIRDSPWADADALTRPHLLFIHGMAFLFARYIIYVPFSCHALLVGIPRICFALHAGVCPVPCSAPPSPRRSPYAITTALLCKYLHICSLVRAFRHPVTVRSWARYARRAP